MERGLKGRVIRSSDLRAVSNCGKLLIIVKIGVILQEGYIGGFGSTI
jgi:hypothetical protein